MGVWKSDPEQRRERAGISDRIEGRVREVTHRNGVERADDAPVALTAGDRLSVEHVGDRVAPMCRWSRRR